MARVQQKDEYPEKPKRELPLVIIRDYPLPAPFLIPELVEQAIDFKPRECDIFVVTYPKCGTTWTQFIVWEIIHKGAIPPSPNQMMFRDFPFLEFTGTEHLDNLPSPRTLKTHLPFNLQPYHPKAKYIYIVRNPWDCCVSYYYHHLNEPGTEDLTFDEYFDCFLAGNIGWGDFFDHVASWYEHRNDPNVLFLTYEGMKRDRKKALLRIAKFLGDSHYEDLKDEVIENCLKHSDFKYMKDLGIFSPKGDDGGLDKKEILKVLKKMGEVDRKTAISEGFQEMNFFRKGEIGDWKNHFTPEHIHRFNEYMQRKLKGTKMEGFWQPLMEETSL